MIIYRPHRGSLAEALVEAKEFNTIKEMKEYIVEENSFGAGIVNNPLLSVKDIVIDDKMTNDTRIGWEDSRYVCTKQLGNDDYITKHGVPQCIGMCATKYVSVEDSIFLLNSIIKEG